MTKYMYLDIDILTPVLLNSYMPCLCKQYLWRQGISEEANWSGSTLFFIKYLNLYHPPRSNNLIGWKLEVGVASQFIQQDKG